MDVLQRMRQQSVIQDDEYWDIKLDGEIVLPNKYPLKWCGMIQLQTKDDVRIELRFDSNSSTGLCVEIYIPRRMVHPLVVSVIAEDYGVSWIPNYDDFNGVYIELLSSSSATDLCFFLEVPSSADLFKPLNNPSLPILGPVQMLDISRCFIRTLAREEIRFLCERKSREVNRIREELMIKACHPKRIAVWIEHGFDPFK